MCVIVIKCCGHAVMMKLFPTYFSEANKDMYVDSPMLNLDPTTFPIASYDSSFVNAEYQVIEPEYSDSHNGNLAYPEGSKDCMKLFQLDYPAQTVSWKDNRLHELNGEDTLEWMINMGKHKDIDISRLSFCSFRNVRGIDLIQMTKSEFIHRIKPDIDVEPNIEIEGEILYEEIKRLKNQIEQDSVVPTVLDSHNYEEKYIHSSDNPHFIDLDDHRKQVAIDSHNDLISVMQCDSGYVSLTEEHEFKMEENTHYDEQDLLIDNNLPVMIAKRPPGRPKGSGKKPQKRVKNVSVPEFLRDLLHDPNYCPRIIKWEDYSRGKFR